MTPPQKHDNGHLAVRVTDMTVDQRASLVCGAGFWHTAAIDDAGIESIMLTDGPHGVRRQTSGDDHLGLAASVPATCFPPAVALGASFDTELITRVGQALGREARAQNVRVLLGPGINIKRSLLCGRNFEYFSEDPHLSGRAGAALVRGIQQTGVGTSVKHFAANNQETERFRISADIDERTLREIYLRAFEHIVTTEQPTTVMCSYNKINGVHSSENHRLLTEILRGEWGFTGVVVSDWGAVGDRCSALAAGLDLEMPATGGRSSADVTAAITEGRLDERYLNESAQRIADLVVTTRMPQSAAQDYSAAQNYDTQAHHELAREAAARSIVLLKNDGDLLPLAPETTVSVFGEFARTPRYQGSGSSQVNPTKLDSALAAMTEIGGHRVSFENDPAAASNTEVAVVFLGLPSDTESEGFDRDTWQIPADQLDLLDAVHTANPNIIVALSHGGTVDVSRITPKAAALVDASLLGQAGGQATADVLYGSVNPSGRLTETIPHRLSDSPAFLDFPGEFGHVRYSEGIFVGYRWYDARGINVAFPFGHGLSYTTFGYSDPRISLSSNIIRMEVDVTNIGDRKGREVVQIYAEKNDPAIARPPRQLVGFAISDLEPGETAAVAVDIDRKELCYWDVRVNSWMLEPGEYTLWAGSSSRELRCTATITLTGDTAAAPLTGDSTLSELLAIPQAREAFEKLVDSELALNNSAPSFLGNPDTVSMVGSMPLQRIAAMGQIPDNRMAELIDRANRY